MDPRQLQVLMSQLFVWLIFIAAAVQLGLDPAGPNSKFWIGLIGFVLPSPLNIAKLRGAVTGTTPLVSPVTPASSDPIGGEVTGRVTRSSTAALITARAE